MNLLLARSVEKELMEWKKNPERKPLLVRGARQVGKSSLIEAFGRTHFESLVVVNFELAPEYKKCFHSLKPHEICETISILSQQKSSPGLLFLDEIQDCPEAIQALRYFKEQMPKLHVIGAGSLLELILKQSEFRMPVGRVSFLYLYPISFKEFLSGFSPDSLKYIEGAELNQAIPPAIHEHLITQLKLYLLLRGMPEALRSYKIQAKLTNVQSI